MSLRVLVFERKHLGIDHNQCSGVLSPPLQAMLRDEYGIALPISMQRHDIHSYALHGVQATVTLRGEEPHGVTQTVRRAEFDAFLMACALEQGIELHRTQVADLEFQADGVLLFTWGGTFRADVVVGAFGCGRVMADTFMHGTPYVPPPLLEALITKHHPHGEGETVRHLLNDRIHVYLPALPRIEFGALIPKGDHVTAITAGRGIRTEDLARFLALPEVRRVADLPVDPEQIYKGRFPVGLARGFYGDRYVIVGDAAGLVRPFKGKGITSAFITGGLAAQVMLDEGISAAHLRAFPRRCASTTGDILYGRCMRRLAWLASHYLSLEPMILLAQRDADLHAVLFDCVSGRETYRNIMRRPGNLRLATRLALATVLRRPPLPPE